jgi:hypothetical protein
MKTYPAWLLVAGAVIVAAVALVKWLVSFL